MPYKDKDAQKKYNRERMRVARKGSTAEGNTAEGNTAQGNTLDEGQLLHPGAAPGAVILSDGQLWYKGLNGYHPKECRCKAHRDRTHLTDDEYLDGIALSGHLVVPMYKSDRYLDATS